MHKHCLFLHASQHEGLLARGDSKCPPARAHKPMLRCLVARPYGGEGPEQATTRGGVNNG